MKTSPLRRASVLTALVITMVVALVLIGLGSLPAVTFPRSSMVIQRADGQKIPFSIEVATTREQEEYGLMFRKSLPRDAGMLFLFKPDQETSFWMKNTYLPLDMLFVRGDGTIAKIATHADPLSLKLIRSEEPVRGVVELNAGEADRRGIHTGDKVLFPAFGNP